MEGGAAPEGDGNYERICEESREGKREAQIRDEGTIQHNALFRRKVFLIRQKLSFLHMVGMMKKVFND